MNYRAEIDGLRAIAVVSVIFYHAKIVIFGRDWFEGGFIGVDIFFVISGYLITRIILTELEQKNTFSFIKFYERRLRRILPMLLVVIAVCIPFAWQKLHPLELIDFAKSALSAIGFGSNFFFYFSTTEYGADSALLKPLLHTWSLGVEEQFYIIVPITILVIWKFARASLLTLLIGMLIMSIQFADVMEVRNSELNFFLPFSRFWELLVGSALAFIELKYGRSKNQILTQTLPIIGLFLIAHSILFFDARTPHPSFQTLIPILGVALVLAFCSTEDFVGKLLSFKPVVGIGLISYSLYLWHFPIFAFGRLDTSNPYDKLGWIVLALLLSVISYFLIEKPFRSLKAVNKKLFSAIILISTSTLIYVNYDFISKDGYRDRASAIQISEAPIKGPWHRLTKNGQECYRRFCNFEVSNSNIDVALFGDSHLASISTELKKALGRKYNFRTANFGGCPFHITSYGYFLDGSENLCSIELQQKRMNFLPEKASIVVLGGRYPLYLSRKPFDNTDGSVESINRIDYFHSSVKKTFELDFLNTVSTLIEMGHRIVLVYPLPEVAVNVPRYIFKQSKKNESNSEINFIFEPLTTSYEVYKKRTSSTFKLFDSNQSPNIYRVYPHKLFCDKEIKGRCVTHNNDNAFYFDDDHPSAIGSEMIVELIMEQIENAEANIRAN